MSGPPVFPRDKESLLRDFSVAIKLRDIQALDRLRDAVEFKWWEPIPALALFVSALGFMATVVAILMADPEKTQMWLLGKIALGWTVPMVLSFVMIQEAAARKLNALRRLNLMTARILEAALDPKPIAKQKTEAG